MTDDHTARVSGHGGPESRQVLTVLLTAVAYFIITLDALVVVTALPSIHDDLGGDIGTLQWTANAYNLAFGAFIITAAALGDRLGRRRVYVVGLALFTAASAACALAPNISALVACRAVQGVGAAIIMPLGLTILTSAFAPERRGAVVGIWGGIAGLGVVCGPLVGGGITQALSWHWIFWVNVPIGVTAMVGASLRLQESRGVKTRIDIPGLALVSGGIAILIWGLVQASQDGWGQSRSIIALSIGAVLLAGFLVWETITPEPMIPLGLFRNSWFASAVSAQFLMSAAIFSAAFLTSQFFQFALGNSPLGTGVRFLPWTATPLIVAPLAGGLSDKVGARPLVVPGLLMQAAGLSWIVGLAGANASYASYVAPFVIAGVGISMALPCVAASGLNAVARSSLGKAAGVLNTTQQMGAVFGVAIVTAVFNAKGTLGSTAAVTSGYRPALAVAAGISALGAIAAIGLRRSPAATAEDSAHADLHRVELARGFSEHRT